MSSLALDGYPQGSGGSLSSLSLLGLKDYGAVGDTQSVSDGTTNGTTTVTSPTAAWTIADVGKTIVIREGTSATVSLVTTIAAFVSSTQITLAAAAAASIAGTANLLWGTDDTAAVVAWLNAFNAAGGGIAFAGKGSVGSHFIVNNDGTPLPQITVKGYIRGLGPRLTIFESLSTTADFFDRATDHLYFEDLEVRNAPRHPSAGSGIKLSSGQLGGLRNVRTSSFWNNVNVVSAYNWVIDDDCYNVDAKNYGVYVQDQASNDRGDQCIGGVISTSQGGTGSAGIRYESGGGLKFGKLKITSGDYGLDLQVADGATTSIALLAAVSMENQVVANVRLGRAGTTGVFDDIEFSAFEFKITGATNVIIAAGVDNVSFAAGVMVGSGVGSIGIDVQGGTNIAIGGGVTFKGMATPIKDNGAAATRLKIDHDAVIYSNVTNLPAIVTKTGTYTIDRTNRYILADATGGSFTATLPTAVNAEGQRYAIKQINSGANVVTVGTTSSQTVDGALTVALTPNQTLEVVSDGANWRAI